MDHFHLKRVE